MATDDLQRTVYQLGLEGFQPFNEAPTYLSGQVVATDADGIQIHGRASRQANSWYNIGAKSESLEPQSFAFYVDSKPHLLLGAYSIGVRALERGLSLNISHFLQSSLSIPEPQIIQNIFSGWGYDSSGQRSQSGIVNSETSLHRVHRLELRYDSARGLLSASANGSPIHRVFGSLQRFHLLLRFQAIAVEGDFDVELSNLAYVSFDAGGLHNAQVLRAWDPQYSPVFISYAHTDGERVRKIVDDFRKVPVRVLGDWDFRPGDSLLDRINKDIARAGYLIVMLSRASTASEWVSRELRIALEGEVPSSRVRILPAVIEDCTMPDFLGDRLWADFRRDDSDGLIRLLGVIRTSGSW